jgi:hypothetical protein
MHWDSARLQPRPRSLAPSALAAAKARGIKLGRNGAERLAPAYRAAAVERARDLAPILAELQSAGLSARQIAAELTARGIPTPAGKRWHGQTVLRMIDRLGLADRSSSVTDSGIAA